MLVAVAMWCLPLLKSGYSAGFDTLPHLFRIHETGEWLRSPGRLLDWTDLWYGGFHQFALYPYFSYLPAGLLAAITDAPVASMDAVIFGSVLAGAVGTFLASRELQPDSADGDRTLPAIAAAVSFALSPAFLGFMFFYGEYSDFVAIGLSPAVFWLFTRAVNRAGARDWVVAAAGLAILQLVHPHVAVFLTAGLGIFVLFSERFELEIARSLVLAVVGSVVLSAFFWIPFFVLRENPGDPTLGTPFDNPVWAVTPGDLFNRGEGWRYLGTVGVVVAAIGMLGRSTWRTALGPALIVLAGVGLAAGGRGPLSGRAPFTDELNPERALVLVLIGTSLLVGLGASVLQKQVTARSRWLAIVVPLVVIAGMGADAWFYRSAIGDRKDFTGDYLATAEFLRAQPGGPLDRVTFLSVDYNLAAYSPLLSGKATFEGSQVQGTAAAWDLLLSDNASADWTGIARLLVLYSRMNVRWVVVDMYDHGGYAEALRGSGMFLERFNAGQFVVLERTWTPSLVRAKSSPFVFEGGPAALPRVADVVSSLDPQPASLNAGGGRPGPADAANYGVQVAPDSVASTPPDSLEHVLLAQGWLLAPATPMSPAATSEVLTFSPKERRIRFELPEAPLGRAVLAQGYSPAWEATLDGVSVETKSDRGLLSFPVSPGRHELVLTYSAPWYQRTAQGFSLAAWLVVVAWLAWPAVRRRRRPATSPRGTG